LAQFEGPKGKPNRRLGDLLAITNLFNYISGTPGGLIGEHRLVEVLNQIGSNLPGQEDVVYYRNRCFDLQSRINRTLTPILDSSRHRHDDEISLTPEQTGLLDDIEEFLRELRQFALT
jgi:hypothetical protein